MSTAETLGQELQGLGRHIRRGLGRVPLATQVGRAKLEPEPLRRARSTALVEGPCADAPAVEPLASLGLVGFQADLLGFDGLDPAGEPGQVHLGLEEGLGARGLPGGVGVDRRQQPRHLGGGRRGVGLDARELVALAPDLGRDAGRLDGDLGGFDPQRVGEEARPPGVLGEPLRVLARADPVGFRALALGRHRLLLGAEGRQLRVRLPQPVQCRLESRLVLDDTRAQVADGPLPHEQRGVAAGGAPTAHGAGRGHHLSRDGHEAGAVAVGAPQPLRRPEVADDHHRAQQVLEKGRVRRAHQLRGFPEHRVVLGDVALGPPVQPLERQERRLAAPLLAAALEDLEGPPGGREALDDDPLEALAERHLDGPLEVTRHLEQVGDRPDDAVQALGARGGEDRLHPVAVPGALGLQLLERGQARATRGERDPRRLGRFDGTPALRRGGLGTSAEIGQRPLQADRPRGRGLEPGRGLVARRGQSLALGRGLAPVRLQALEPSSQLPAPLLAAPEDLAELGAPAGERDLLAPEPLGGVPRLAQPRADLLEPRFLGRRPPAEPLELLPQRPDQRLLRHSLVGERGEPRGERGGFLGEPLELRRQLLLGPLQLGPAGDRRLQLQLGPLPGQPQVGRPVLGGQRVGPHELLLGAERGHARLERLGPRRGLGLADGEVRLLLGQPDVLDRQQGELERPPLGLEGLVLLGLLRLALQRAELALDLVHDVAYAEEVLAGGLQLPQGLGALQLVPRDPGRLLDEEAAVEGLRGEDVGQALLLHQRVGLGVDARPQEEVVDVLQAADLLVEEVLGLPVPVEAPAHRDLAPGQRHVAVVGEGQEGLGQPERPPRAGPVEDDVFHAMTAEGLGALLAEGPAQRVGDVRLPAAVRPDDRRDARKDLHLRPVGEGLEAEQRDRLQPHARQALVSRPRSLAKGKIQSVAPAAPESP